MVSLPVRDSAVAPFLHGCPAFLQKHSPPWTLFPQPTAVLALGLLSNPHAPLAPSHCAFWRLCVPVQSMWGCGTDFLCGSHSIQTVTNELLQSPAVSDASPLSQPMPLCGDLTPAPVPHSPGAGQVLFILLLLFPSFLCLTEFWVELYLPFWWSEAPDSTQLVLCKIFCIWRYIPHTSVERDIPPCPLAPPPSWLLFFFWVRKRPGYLRKNYVLEYNCFTVLFVSAV